MKIHLVYIGLLSTLLVTCMSSKNAIIYETENLQIQQLTDKTFIHVSYLQTEDYGKVACNGLVYIDGNESAVIDTPTDSTATSELLNWLIQSKKATPKIVVPTHFHGDCIGGLNQFHAKNVMSYGNSLTIEYCIDADQPFPKVGFDDQFELPIGSSTIVLDYPGAGHTEDNIIAFIPSENILFGGCLVKSIGASKGFTGDANLDEWSYTLQYVKSNYPQSQYIIPGHGEPGDQELLDYTIGLFQ